jgi:hypothetical protein
MLLAGIGTQIITALAGTPLGGYWGRDPEEGCSDVVHDNLFARVLTLNKLHCAASATDDSSPSTNPRPWCCIVSLDLVGLHSSMCDLIKSDIIAAMPGETPLLSTESIMVCCTHTHTGPQTHKSFVGMGHASEDYFHRVLRAGVVEAFLESVSTMTPSTLLHGRTRPLVEISINRRQRRREEEGREEAPSAAKWFEKAGKTVLGQRPDGPKMDSAEILQFRRESGGDEEPPLLTLVCYACHPTTVGPELEQSSDFCGALVSTLETEVNHSFPNHCLVFFSFFFFRSKLKLHTNFSLSNRQMDQQCISMDAAAMSIRSSIEADTKAHLQWVRRWRNLSCGLSVPSPCQERGGMD